MATAKENKHTFHASEGQEAGVTDLKLSIGRPVIPWWYAQRCWKLQKLANWSFAQLQSLVLDTCPGGTVIGMASLVLEHCKHKHGQLREFELFVLRKWQNTGTPVFFS